MKYIYVVTYYIETESHHIEVYFNKDKAFKAVRKWIDEHDFGAATIAVERTWK